MDLTDHPLTYALVSTVLRFLVVTSHMRMDKMNISTAFVYCFLVVLAGGVLVEGLSDQKRSTEQEDIGERKRPLRCEGKDELYPHTTDCMRRDDCSLGITVHPMSCERIYRAYSHMYTVI